MIDPKKIKKRKNQKVDERGVVNTKRGRKPFPYETVRWSLYVPKTLKLEVEKWLEIHIKNSNEKNEMPEYKSSSGIASELFRKFLTTKLWRIF